MDTWQDFVRDSGYPMRGEPSTTRFFNPRIEMGFYTDVFALLDYDERGYLRAALIYFPNGAMISEGSSVRMDLPGSLTIMVRPSSRRQGHATRLLDDAIARWPEIDMGKQIAASKEGALFAAAYQRPASVI